MQLDETKLNTLLETLLNDMGAFATGNLVVIGDRLGLYRTLASEGPLTSGQLAEQTGTAERYVREWLANQAASGYITYHADSGSFSMTPEQAAALADDDSPALMTGGFLSATGVAKSWEKLESAFRTGDGIGWGEHDACLFCGTEKFFRPGYRTHLVGEWLPALEGVTDKLAGGAKVADIGCGRGASTIVMGKAFPNSTFVGFDFHPPSVEGARAAAAEEGADNVSFEVASAKDFPGTDWDLAAFFDCLHDMGDPAGACAHVCSALKPDGTLMIVEPFAHDELEDNLHQLGRAYYAFSTSVCTPASLSQEVGRALGAQAGEKRLAEVVREGGFTRFRRATETPFNLILEARP